MSLHLSQLVLDELASEVAAPAGAREHLEGCAQCSARLAAVRRDREASVKSFGYARTRARVAAERPARWRELLPFIVPVAAALLFLVIASLNPGKAADPRLKGGPTVDFLRAGQPVTEAKPGDVLELQLGAVGLRHAIVLSVDKDREVDVLFDGELPPGAVVTLPRRLEVTPGSVVVHAFLSEQPLDAKRAVSAMENEIRQYAGWPLEAPPPQSAGVTVASQRLYVKP
ncbi:MAG: hypothetical protein IPJ65_09045 [Archangiaceae bacterium]|nr:hypothetical protein [Archangiaceae bacterium]